MAKKITISAALATFNEEENLERCLTSVFGWVDQIVIVDGGSTDKTIEIAKKFHVKLIETTNPPIFHINKQKALDACTGDWILQLDADESVTQELAEEIQKVVRMTTRELEMRKINPEKKLLFDRHQRLIEERDGIIGNKMGDIVAFFIARKNYFLGKFIRYAGTYPDGVIRLVKNGNAKFPAKGVHEQIQVDGRVSWLTNDLIHYSNPTLKRYMWGADKYTNLLADQYKVQNVPKNIFSYIKYTFIEPTWLFLTLFIRYKGILDGIHGFLFCFFSALHPPIAFLKYFFART